MKADTLNLNDLFRKDIRFLVPMFQRPYVWTEEGHWQLLWQDLQEVVELLLENRDQATYEQVERREPEDKTPPLFLGAIVLDQMATQTSRLESREVIDGQQRLTTLQVLISAARTVAEELEFKDQVSFLDKFISNDRDLIKDDDHVLKVWPIEPDQDAFRKVILDPTLAREESETNDNLHGLVDAFRFFVAEIRDWTTHGPESAEERLDALTSTLWWLIRTVVIDLEPKDDPQVIFETLNARGTPLLAADLMKNLIFREAKKDGLSTEPLHTTYWERFDQKKWREEVRQGRLERPRIDVFVMHWLTMRTREIVKAQQLFPEFRKYLIRTDSQIEDVLRDISHYDGVYERCTPPYPKGRDGLFFQRLDAMETTTPMPALLWIYGDDSFARESQQRCIEIIESWLLRRMLCKLTTKNYNRVFIDLLKQLEGSKTARVDGVVLDFFQTREAHSEYWPKDEELSSAMINSPYWSRINRRRLRMVFLALERELRSTGFTEELDISQRLHIEHILPQEWAHHWSLPGKEPAEIERLNRDEAKHTIGNLTILTEKLNPSISNAAWEKKRKAIGNHSVLLLNSSLKRLDTECAVTVRGSGR